MLFDEIVFGPVISRRLGVSLGINLLPVDGKICSFDCVYCECGLNAQGHGTSQLPDRAVVAAELERKLKAMKAADQLPDVITFAGNGEPTLHADFNGIIRDTLFLRDAYAPNCRIAVLSNASTLHRPDVVEALTLIDDNILKIDAGTDSMARLIDAPKNPNYSLQEIAQQMRAFNGRCTVQTLFLRGKIGDSSIDNTTEEELAAWFELLKIVAPEAVMLYSFSRVPPVDTLQKVEIHELEALARRVEDLLPGVKTIVA